MFKYEEFAEAHMIPTIKTGAEWMVRCLFHDEANGSMQFNAEKGLYICFSCGEKGNIVTLMKHLGLKRIEEAEPDLQEILATLESLNDQSGRPSPMKVIPEKTLKRYEFETPYWGKCTDDRFPPEYCIGAVGCPAHRWFSHKTIEAFDLGYDPLRNYATIPTRNVRGQLVGVIRRFLDPDVEIRYKYPKGYKRTENLFASWLIEQDPYADEIALVEGSVDAAWFWQAGIPAGGQYGSSIGRPQIRLLRKLGVRSIVLAFDNDKAGKKATDYALGNHWHRDRDTGKMFKTYDPTTDLSREFNVRIMKYTSDMGNDPNKCTAKQLVRQFDAARTVS